MKRPVRARGRSLALVLALALGACGGSPPKSEKAPELRKGAWTKAFGQEAVVVADRVLIEGPADLLEHVAVRQEPAVCDYQEETVPDGLRQTVEVRQGVGAAEIHAQLDAWTIVAMQKLVVLQRPGEATVKVRAVGNAVYIPAEGGQEQRQETLEFRGVREAP